MHSFKNNVNHLHLLRFSQPIKTLISEFAFSREFFFTNLFAFFSALVYELLIASSWTWIPFVSLRFIKLFNIFYILSTYRIFICL